MHKTTCLINATNITVLCIVINDMYQHNDTITKLIIKLLCFEKNFGRNTL